MKTTHIHRLTRMYPLSVVAILVSALTWPTAVAQSSDDSDDTGISTDSGSGDNVSLEVSSADSTGGVSTDSSVGDGSDNSFDSVTATDSATATDSVTATDSATATATDSATATATATDSDSDSDSSTLTPTPTDSSTLTPTPTDSSTDSSTPTLTDSSTPTLTDSLIASPTDSFIASITPTSTDGSLTISSIQTSSIAGGFTAISSDLGLNPTATPSSVDAPQGLSNSNKAIVSGVVGGVVGIVFFAGLIFYGFRRSKRSRRYSDLEIFQPQKDHFDGAYRPTSKHEWSDDISVATMAQDHQPYGMRSNNGYSAQQY